MIQSTATHEEKDPEMETKRLKVSFSGGKTSAFMAGQIKQHYEHLYDDVLYVFANTGQEHDKTLDFVHAVDMHFGLNLVWLESVVLHGERKSSTYRAVDYESAARANDWRTGRATPFEEVIKKYGIPNQARPHCTRELKQNPMHAFARDYWQGEHYQTAIGIRVDEMRRVAKNPAWDIVYPLIDWLPTDKQDVNDYWDSMPFSLDIEEHQGNCVTCWKKSDRKLLRLLAENNAAFDFFDSMEQRYRNAGAGDENRVFFRQHRSVANMRAIYNEQREQLARSWKQAALWDDADADGGCSESCELYPMESRNDP